MYTNDKDLLQLVAKITGIRKTSIQVIATESVDVHGVNWSGGCRNKYYAIDLAHRTGVQETRSNTEMLPYDVGTVKLQPGIAVAKVAYYGLRTAIDLYVHPENFRHDAIPQVSADITTNELIVLWFTRTMKSSYGGISNYRYHSAKECFPHLTENAWNEAKQSLIERKYLNRAGAITPAGRNACPQAMSHYCLREELGLTPQHS